MRIRHLSLGIIVGLSAASTLRAQASSDSARVESIERFFVVADMERAHTQALVGSIDAQVKSNPAMAQFAEVLMKFTTKYSSFAATKPDLIQLYRQTYSEAEIQELTNFYQTEFGRRMFAKSAEISLRSTQLAAERVRQHLPELSAAIEAAVRGVPPSL